MQFNSLYRLIYRKDKLITSQIDGQSAAIYLDSDDLNIIDYVDQYKNQSIKELLSDEWFRLIRPSITSFHLQSRLTQLKDGHIVIDQQSLKNDTKAINFNDVDLDKGQLPEQLTTSKHLAFDRVNNS